MMFVYVELKKETRCIFYILCNFLGILCCGMYTQT